MKFLKYTGIFLGALLILYIVHVPTLVYLTKPKSDVSDYPSVTAQLETESFEMVRMLDDRLFNVWYDTQSQGFVLFGETSGKRVFITLDPQGQILTTEDNHYNDPIPYENNPRYVEISQSIERKYVPNYDFADLKGSIELVHYQFEDFSEPYIYYFVPVIPFDWEGTGYINIHHQSETFEFKIPTTLYSGSAYLDANIDGQIYIYPSTEYAPDIAFISIKESSHAGTHRDGLGFHIIRPK